MVAVVVLARVFVRKSRTVSGCCIYPSPPWSLCGMVQAEYAIALCCSPLLGTGNSVACSTSKAAFVGSKAQHILCMPAHLLKPMPGSRRHHTRS